MYVTGWRVMLFPYAVLIMIYPTLTVVRISACTLQTPSGFQLHVLQSTGLLEYHSKRLSLFQLPNGYIDFGRSKLEYHRNNTLLASYRVGYDWTGALSNS